MTISTRNLSELQPPGSLERLLVSLATLDAILSPEWAYRYYSFNKNWDVEKNHRMGSMRNGSGDEFVVLFTPVGGALKGFAHEYPQAKTDARAQGLFEGFPESLEGFLDEPAFNMGHTTFCLWCVPPENWTAPLAPHEHPDPDGSAFLLEHLTGNPQDYQRFAGEYYEKDLPLEAVRSIYEHAPLTQPLVAAINQEVSLADLAKDLEQIGYPH